MKESSLEKKSRAQEVDQLIKNLNLIAGVTEIYRITNKDESCEFVLTYYKKENLFMYVIDGGNKRDQKKLLKRALKELKIDIPLKLNKFTLDDIYDITSLTSSDNLVDLCKKIRLVLTGILN